MTNIITLLDIEYKLLFRRKLSSFMAFIFPLAFYLLFTSLIDMPADAKKVFYKEYMYSMTVFSLKGILSDAVSIRNNRGKKQWLV